MLSVEEELNEIEQGWDVKYLEETTSELRYVVELKNQEVSLKFYIPENYPESIPEIKFGEKEIKGIDENMQRNILKSLNERIISKIGKPMMKYAVEDIWSQVKAISSFQQKKSNSHDTGNGKLQKKRKPKKRAKMAAQFGLFGGLQVMPTLANVVEQSVAPDIVTKSETKEINKAVVNQKKMKQVSPEKKHGKAPPMKTARDVINRIIWDEQLNREEFIVGYEDRFVGIIEVPVFDLNWQDDISATGPADKLAIPEHRVQYFKWRQHIIWQKENRIDLVFASTGSEIGILDFIEREKQHMQPSVDDSEVEQIDVENSFPNADVKSSKMEVESNLNEIEIVAKEFVENIISSIQNLEISPEPQQVPHGGGHHSNNLSQSSSSSVSYQNERYSYNNRSLTNHSLRDQSDDFHKKYKRDESNDSRRNDRSRNSDLMNCCIFSTRPNGQGMRWVQNFQNSLQGNISIPKYLNVNLATCTIDSQGFGKFKKILNAFSKEMRPLKIKFCSAKIIDDDVVFMIEESDSLQEFFGRLRERLLPYQLDIFPHMKVAKVYKTSQDIGSVELRPFEHWLKYVSVGKDQPVQYHAMSQARGNHHSTKRKIGNEFGQFQYQHSAQKPRVTEPDRKYKDNYWEVKIGKKLSGVLRHNELGFQIDEEGFVEVNKLLSHQFFRNNNVLEEDIVRIVKENRKERFKLKGENGNLKIRATQGHSVEFTKEEDHLQEIRDPSNYPNVVHGTRLKFWDSVKEEGLSRRKRNHIHMTTAEPHSRDQVISGMRDSSNCFIYIDIEEAMKDGIKFYLSENGVILSKGEDGFLQPKYFKEVYGIRNKRRQLLYPLPDQNRKVDRKSKNASTQEKA